MVPPYKGLVVLPPNTFEVPPTKLNVFYGGFVVPPRGFVTNCVVLPIL